MFTVTDLGILPGKAFSQATAISTNGTVVGYSATAGFSLQNFSVNQHEAAQGWIYANGVQTPMIVNAPTIPLGINAAGQIIGVTSGTPNSGYDFAPFFYLNGIYNTPLGFDILNVCDKCQPDLAAPVAISDAGVVALTSNPEESAVVGDAGPFMEAGVWADGVVTPLPIPSDCPQLKPASGLIHNPNFCLTRALGISQNGQNVAGYVWYWNRRVFEPVLWVNGQLKIFPQGGLVASVNNSGQGAGFHLGQATIFNPDGSVTGLQSFWFPVSINNNGAIVGNDQGYVSPGNIGIQPETVSLMPGAANAILWMNNKKYNLNSCSCISNSSGWEFDFAYGINDAGQIVGTGFHNGVQTGFLLTPGLGPVISAVVNGASFAGGGVVPGEIATAFGTNLTSSTGINLTSSLPLPNVFLTDSLMVNDNAVALFAVDNVNGQQQINFQVPWEVASGPNATIAVSNNGTAGASITVPVLAAQPGIFNYSAGGNTFGAILHANFQLADTGHPAKAGETVLIYCTGLGAVSSPPADGAAGNGQTTMNTPTVTIGGTKASVSFSGLAPGFVGLYQINAEIPAGLTAGNQAVIVEVGGSSSNSVLLPLE